VEARALKPRPVQRRVRGVTLIEILVVVAIIGVMTSLALVAMGDIQFVSRSNGDLEVIGQYIRNARMRALAQGCAHVVRVSGSQAPAPATNRRAAVELFRKGNCRGLNVAADWIPTGTAGRSPRVEDGDVPVNSASMGVQTRLRTGLDDIRAFATLVTVLPNGAMQVYRDDGSAVTLTAVADFNVQTKDGVGVVRTLRLNGGNNVGLD
jgi:prepilin-type N-terminal cleavage/methylation domain-containing protein